MSQAPTSHTIRLMINGEWQEVPAGWTVESLLQHLGLADKPVAVERNLQVVPKARHSTTPLADGDKLEIVTLVGGG